MVELIPNSRELSFPMREAEFAIRLRQPDQHDLVLRRVGTIACGLYGSPDYLGSQSDVEFAAGCPGHRLITQSEDKMDASVLGWLSDHAPRARVAMQTSSHEAAIVTALHGGGLARFRADPEDGLQRLAVPSPMPTASMWLIVHRDNRQTPRIRAVLTHIAERIRKMAPALCPADAVEDEQVLSENAERVLDARFHVHV